MRRRSVRIAFPCRSQYLVRRSAGLAQLVEHLICNQGVTGSSPVAGTRIESVVLVPRKLRTYVTSVGFFELAVAAPSMKAAMEAWGAESNLFQQGFAKETTDPAIVRLTMAKPGVVLRRSVGSRGAFGDHAELPKSLPAEKPNKTTKPQTSRVTVTKSKAPANVANLAEAKAAKRAAAALEKVRARREAEERKREAAIARERALRAAASAKAERALEKARQTHDAIVRKINTEREALDRRADFEGARWNREKERREEKLRRTRV